MRQIKRFFFFSGKRKAYCWCVFFQIMVRASLAVVEAATFTLLRRTTLSFPRAGKRVQGKMYGLQAVLSVN